MLLQRQWHHAIRTNHRLLVLSVAYVAYNNFGFAPSVNIVSKIGNQLPTLEVWKVLLEVGFVSDLCVRYFEYFEVEYNEDVAAEVRAAAVAAGIDAGAKIIAGFSHIFLPGFPWGSLLICAIVLFWRPSGDARWSNGPYLSAKVATSNGLLCARIEGCFEFVGGGESANAILSGPNAVTAPFLHQSIPFQVQLGLLGLLARKWDDMSINDIFKPPGPDHRSWARAAAYGGGCFCSRRPYRPYRPWGIRHFLLCLSGLFTSLQVFLVSLCPLVRSIARQLEVLPVS